MDIPITHRDLTLLVAAEPFSHPDWIFELKYDGFRVLALKDRERVRLLSRHGQDMAAAFPELVAELGAIKGSFAVDGELVVLDAHGRPQFEGLCRRAWLHEQIHVHLASRVMPAAIFGFDLLHACGEDYRNFPLVKRKAALRSLLRRSKRVRCAAHVEREGHALYDHVQGMELEGIVAKRSASLYRAGRSPDWLKIKTYAAMAREA